MSPMHGPPPAVTVMPSRPHRKPVPPAADDGNDAGDGGRIAGTVDTAIPEDAAGAADGMPPAHINGREAAPDPLEIPEFLRRVH